MSHATIIIDDKLSCIASAFPNLSSLAIGVKDTARELHAQWSAVVNSTEETDSWHTALEDLQSQASAVCDTPTNFTETQVREVLEDAQSTMSGYLN